MWSPFLREPCENLVSPVLKKETNFTKGCSYKVATDDADFYKEDTNNTNFAKDFSIKKPQMTRITRNGKNLFIGTHHLMCTYVSYVVYF